MKFRTLQTTIIALFFSCTLIFITVTSVYYIIAGSKLAESRDVLEQIFIAINNITYHFYFLTSMVSLYFVHFFLDVIDANLNTILKVRFVTEKQYIEVLRLVSILMDKICYVMDVFKLSNRMNVVMFVHYFAFIGVICTYSGILIMTFDYNSEFIKFFSMAAIWIIYNSLFFAWTFAFSSLIQKKCQTIELTCIKFLTKSESTSGTGKSIQLLSLQLYHRQPIFSCQMFIIDWNFLFHLIAESFSYLVIIFQFDINMYK